LSAPLRRAVYDQTRRLPGRVDADDGLRAPRAVEEELRAVVAERTIAVDSIRAVENNGWTRILAGDHVITTVVDADAVPGPRIGNRHR